MKNLEFAESIVGVLDMAIAEVKRMPAAYLNGDADAISLIVQDLEQTLPAIQNAVCNVDAEKYKSLIDGCTCARDSLEDVVRLIEADHPETIWKMKNELRMILEGVMCDFFRDHIVKYDESRMEELMKRADSCAGWERFAEDADGEDSLDTKSWKNTKDITISITAYNHLDVTKMCVESLLETMPEDLDCELILVNHGSSDGTREYFESIPDAHVINISINRAFWSHGIQERGRYTIAISNDIILAPNTIKNMYLAIKNHQDYGYVVPSTPNVSNYQTIAADYGNLEEFKLWAKENNQYDERRQEQRVRLCNPLYAIRPDHDHLCNRELFLIMGEDNWSYTYPDDRLSLWMRRHGFKNILVKDAYCHHIGSVTINEDVQKDGVENATRSYEESRKEFERRYGVDPWGLGFCYDRELFIHWNFEGKENARILGINCGLGANSLKIKEILREQGAKNPVLYNVTQEAAYLEDLKGVSDQAYVIDGMEDIPKVTGCSEYDYIIIEGTVKGLAPESYREQLEACGISCLHAKTAFCDGNGNWSLT